MEDNDPMEVQQAKLLDLQEKKEKYFASLKDKQQVVKKWFDKKSSNPRFKSG